MKVPKKGKSKQKIKKVRNHYGVKLNRKNPSDSRSLEKEKFALILLIETETTKIMYGTVQKKGEDTTPWF